MNALASSTRPILSDEQQPLPSGKISFFLPDLTAGGAQRAAVKLINALHNRGCEIDLVVVKKNGPALAQVQPDVRFVDLPANRVAKSVFPFANYLSNEQPRVVISFLSHANIAAVTASQLTRTKCKLILVEQNMLSLNREFRRDRLIPMFARRIYRRADAIVAVSVGVSDDLINKFGVSARRVSVIHNPIVDQELIDAAAAPLNHPWFADGSPPVFLAAGRLTPQKDFPTLLEAFRLVRKGKAAKLIILGEGKQRGELQDLIASKGLGEDVSLPGFVENPYAYMSRSRAFVLSSRWEGLPTVLVEALACGCPVISTDCPSGLREILKDGLGQIVPVGDPVSLSRAMLAAVDSPPDRSTLQAAAFDYSVDRAASRYLNLISSVLSKNREK